MPVLKLPLGLLLLCGLAWASLAGSAFAQVANEDEIKTPPKPVKRTQPEYPFDMRRAGQMGAAIVEFIVTTRGTIIEAQSVAETDFLFGKAAVNAVSGWKFKPGMVDKKPVNTRMLVPIYFTLSGSGIDDISAKIESVITGFPPKSPEAVPAEFQYDQAPKPFRYQPPVWPWVDGKPVREGTADVYYGIDSNGVVAQVRVVSATSEVFGKAAQAAVECWRFKPAERDGKPVPALGRREVNFKLYLSKDMPELRQLEAIEDGTANYADPASLDEKLRPLSREAAQYPMALIKEGVGGTAVIECIIDRSGKVVLPRIIEASREEFGWSAATAASRWRFAPPTVKGKPVDVKVRIPFKFVGMEKPAE